MLVPLRSVFSTRPASFITVGLLDDAVRHLAAVVKRSWWREWAIDCLIGRVSADHVEVRRHRAGSRDPLPAVFVGAFSADGDKVILAGHFRHSTASRILLVAASIVFAVFFAASTVFGVVLMASTRPFAQKVGAGMFVGALMIASALALWRSTQPLTEEDISVVSAGIQQALDAPSVRNGRTTMSHWLVALVCMVLAVGPAVADDRANLIGTWKLAGGEIEFQDTGERRPLYGTDRMGYIIFTREGRMMGIIEGDGRKAPQTDEDRARLLRTMVAYSGLYRLEGDKWVTAVDVAWNPAWTGTDQVRFYKLEGDRLAVNTPWAPSTNFPGRTVRVYVTWTRVK